MIVNPEFKDLFDGKKVDFTNPTAMAEDCWLFLTNDSMPDVATIKKEAFLHEVEAALRCTIRTVNALLNNVQNVPVSDTTDGDSSYVADNQNNQENREKL
jgi:hypothetical protein